jgi:hypothetical protein
MTWDTIEDDKLVVKAQMHTVDAVHWEIADFSRLSAARKSSQWFPYGGQRWCMFLDPKGDEKSDQFSVFLNLVDATSLADGLSLNRVFSLSLLSQRSSATTISRRVDDAKFHAKLSGWGYRDFAKLDVLSTGYLDQDKLVLPTQIHGVDTIMWEVTDFSKLAATRKRSGSFYFGGLKWSLLLDPKGDEKSCKLPCP